MVNSKGCTGMSGAPVPFVLLQDRQAGTTLENVCVPPFASGTI
jgi:hypothetical protein